MNDEILIDMRTDTEAAIENLQVTVHKLTKITTILIDRVLKLESDYDNLGQSRPPTTEATSTTRNGSSNPETKRKN